MTTISRELSELINLTKAIHQHRKTCVDPDCGVSLLQLQWTAQRLAKSVRPSEKEEADKLVEGMPLL